MSTLRDELLQDFEDSGSEAGVEELGDGLLGTHPSSNGDAAMAEYNDDDEEGDGDAMDGLDDDTANDSETAKAKIEKMNLGGVRDVRTVAGLLKTLQPVLEVSASISTTLRYPLPREIGRSVYISLS